MSDFWHNVWVLTFLITLSGDAIISLAYSGRQRPVYGPVTAAAACVMNLLMLWAFWNLVGGWA